MNKIAYVVLIAGLTGLSATARAATCGGTCAVAVDQVGSAQYAVSLIQKGGTASDTSGSNTAAIAQSGAGRQSVDLKQTFNGPGSANNASVTQSGSADDTFTGSQKGSGNQMTVQQSATTGLDQASITQVGAMNVANVAQNTSALGGSNYASVNQVGASNQVMLAQNGVDDTAYAKQTGGDDMLSITQNGNNDYASLTQTGSGLGYAVSQKGNNASVTVSQTPAGAVVTH